MKRGMFAALTAALALFCFSHQSDAQQPQYQYYTGYQLSKWYYYPYMYFPHNYWPAQGPRWPEAQGMPYMKPPAYQAYPPFQEKNWRYELWQPQRYYRGNHFWLDQF